MGKLENRNLQKANFTTIYFSIKGLSEAERELHHLHGPASSWSKLTKFEEVESVLPQDFSRNLDELDNKEFSYSTQKACASSNGTIIVKSARQNFSRREKMRKELQAKLNFTGDVFFIVGDSEQNDRSTEDQESILEAEASAHSDLIRSNFIDVYNNILKKSLSAINFFVTQCENSDHLFLIDDDVIIYHSETFSNLTGKYNKSTFDYNYGTLVV